jgi:putative hemolysin
MNKVQIEKLNEVHIKIYANDSILMELSDYFTFDVPGAKFSPLFRQKRWDGKIRLLNINNQKIYTGLAGYIEHYCNQKGYEVEYLYDNNTKQFSIKEAEDFVSSLNLTLKPREYQLDSYYLQHLLANHLLFICCIDIITKRHY